MLLLKTIILALYKLIIELNNKVNNFIIIISQKIKIIN